MNDFRLELDEGAGAGAALLGIPLLRMGGPKAGLMAGARGAFLGGVMGFGYGAHKADKKYLGDKGIKMKYGGLTASFSPEAAKKYLK